MSWRERAYAAREAAAGVAKWIDEANAIRHLTVYCLVLIAVVSMATAQTALFTDDFEDGNADGWTTTFNETQGGSTVANITSDSIAGSFSMYHEAVEPNTDGNVSQIRNRTDPITDLTINNSTLINVSLKFKINQTGDANQVSFIDIIDGNEEMISFGIDDDAGGRNWEINGNGLGVTLNESGDATDGQVHNLTLEIDLAENRTTLWVDGTRTVNTSVTGGFSQPSNISIRTRVRVSSDGTSDQIMRTWYDDFEVTELEFGTLTLEHDKFMQHGQQQQYDVLLDETEVSSQASVTSSNTSVVAVNQSNTTLIATSNVTTNAQVTITAQFEGMTATRNVTVANLSSGNVALMPDAGSMTSAIWGDVANPETGERPGGTQLTMRVLFVALLIGAAIATWASAFAGIGGITVIVVMGWFMGWVDGGMMLITVFTGLFIGLNLAANPGPIGQ